MKKINFKHPKYIIPLIMLPFIFLFFFIFQNWGSGKATAKADKDSIPANQLNPNMPGVSNEVSDAALKDKFGAYLDAYKHNTDASALYNIENNGALQSNDFTSAYSPEELQKLLAQQKQDSLSREMKKGQSDINRRISQLQSNNKSLPLRGRSGGGHITQQDILNGFTFNADEATDHKPEGKDNIYNEQMKLFRDQMSVMDSIQQTYTQKATSAESAVQNGEGASLKTRKTLTNNFDPDRFDPSKDSSFRPLPVRRDRGTRTSFNTIAQSRPEQQITAIIDQDIKATAGSRVRIRLLNDIFVGNYLIPKGTYIYGVVTGFQTQRVNISINQILQENHTLPVELEVFDNDGYLGLYVPGSTFREFTKEIGTQGTQGLSQVRTSDNSNVTTGLINQIFQSTSTSVSKLIQKEKAFLKYNYIVYLKERK